MMNIYKLCNINELDVATAVTVGMFDGVHVGHQHILSNLIRQAEMLKVTPVVVTFDLHPRQILGGGVGGGDIHSFYRITTNEERYRVLERFGISHVVEIHFTPEVAALSACEFFEQILVEKLHAKGLVLGFDNMFGSKRRNDFDQLPARAEALGVQVLVDNPVRLNDIEVSSTQVRKALKGGQVELAKLMLGYPYRLWGEVVKGRQVGRTLGFPTANVCLDDTTKVMPEDGVYAVKVHLQGCNTTYIGMANLGAQPTFGLEKPVFEVNIFDFDADIYGRILTVEFEYRLRDVCRFGSIDELVAQLNADRDAARAEFVK